MASLQRVRKVALRGWRRLAASDEGSLPVESMLMIAVAAMILIGLTNIVGVDTSGDVSGGWFETLGSFVPGLLGF
jgi:hypothetical protein